MGSTVKSGISSRSVAAVLLVAGLALAGCSTRAPGSTTTTTTTAGTGPTVALEASSAKGSFQPGIPFTLSWTSSDPNATCTAGGGAAGDGWTGTEPANGTATVTEATAGSYTYSLSCVDAGGTGVGTTSIVVATAVVATPAPGVVLLASGSFEAGVPFTLTWTSTGTGNVCTASGGAPGDGWSGTEPANGSAKVTETTTGTYGYLLTCVNAGGSGVGTATVEVGTVPAPTVSLNLTPNPVAPSTATVTNTTTLTWSTVNAKSCTAAGGDGSDGWTGAQPTSGTLSINVPQTVGSYTYILNCVSSANVEGSGSIQLLVTTTPPPTVNVSVTPSSVAVGGSSTISWTTVGATACTASGSWNGTEPLQSPAGGVSTGALATAGVYDYTLTCTNANGSTSNTAYLTVGTPPPPTVSISVSPTTIRPGQSATLSWTSTNATSCTASASWSGSEPLQSPVGGVSTGVLLTDGAYSYTLTCSGPSGTVAADALLIVSGVSVVDDCGVGVPSTTLISPAYTATDSASGLCTLLSALGVQLCTVNNVSYVVSGEPDAYTTINVDVDALTLGTESLLVAPTSEPATPGPVLPGGRTVGFVISNPNEPVTVNLIQSLSVSTLLDGTVVQTAGGNSATKLGVLSLINVGSTSGVFVNFTTAPGDNFDSLELTDTAGLATVLGTVDVYNSCVTNQ